MKKILCAVITVCLILSASPIATFATDAQIISECLDVSDELTFDTPVKTYSFTPQVSGLYLFSCESQGDSVVKITDGNNVLSENDDADFTNLNSALGYYLTADNTYYYEVSCLDNLSTDNLAFTYSLEKMDREISSVIFGTGELMYMTDGWLLTEYSENTNEYVEYFYYEVPKDISVSIVYSDGFIIDTTLGNLYNSTKIGFEVSSQQSADNVWNVGQNQFSIDFAGVSYPVNVNIVESNVSSITISQNSYSIYENTNGYEKTDYFYDSTTQQESFENYFYYSPNMIADFTVTVFYKDGHGQDEYSVFELQNQTGYMMQYITDQNSSNVWGVGTHTVICSFMGAQCSLTLEIIQSPIKSLSVVLKNPDIVQYTNGMYETDDFGEGQPGTGTSWFYYNFSDSMVSSVTLVYQDDTTRTFSGDNIADELWQEYEASLNFYIEQWSENELGIGQHELTVSFLGKTTSTNINIVESPVSSISIIPSSFETDEGSGGYMREDPYYNQESGMEEFTTYYEYVVPREAMISVQYKDGTNASYSLSSIYEETGYDYTVSSDQSFNNQWGIGVHNFTVTYMGVSTSVSLTISENPVASISVSTSDSSIIENTHGYMRFGEIWNENTFQWEYSNYCVYVLDLASLTMTINYTDHTTETYSGQELIDFCNTNQKFIEVSSDQSEVNTWKVGSHTYNVKWAGRSCDVAVEITPSPVESIIVLDGLSQIYEHTYEYTGYQHYFNFGSNIYYTVPYVIHKLPLDMFTLEIHMKNGDVITTSADRESIVEETGNNEYEVDIITNENANDTWDIGNNDITLSYMGFLTQYSVEMVSHTIGDINDDGDLSIEDYAALRSVAVRQSSVSANQKAKYDVNNDNAVDAFDMFMLDRVINNFITISPYRFKGDADNDNDLDENDCRIIENAIASQTITPNDILYFDFNGNGIIDTADVDELRALVRDNYNMMFV